MATGPSSGAGTKERLLEAAIRCIEDKGYAETTARDISSAAGANLASIGYHFGSKDELLDEALVVATERWLGPLLRGAGAPNSRGLRDRFADGLTEFLASLEANRPLNVAFVEALTRMPRSEPLRARLADNYDRLRHALAITIAGDEPTHPDLAAVASAVIALFDGMMLQHLIDPARPVDVAAALNGLGAILRG